MRKLIDLFSEPYNMYAISNVPVFFQFLVKNSNKIFKCIIIGADEQGILLFDILKNKFGIDCDCFLDYSLEFREYDGVNAYTVTEVISDEIFVEDYKYIAFIASDKYRHDIDYRNNVDRLLQDWGVDVSYDAGDLLRPFKRGWTSHYFKQRINELNLFYESLYDDVSKDTMYEYLRTYFTGNRYRGLTYPEEYKYWGLEDEHHKLFNIKKGVLLNIGAYVGDTLMLFLQSKIEFEKIIAVEADSEMLKKLLANVECLPEQYKRRIQVDHYFLGDNNSRNEKSIDELYNNENIALINMDIEGAELSALNSGVETIKKNRPILSICAYHKRDDLIEIPKFIEKNFENYVYFLRKYPSMYFYGFDGVQQINELVLYAVPKEQLS